MKIWKGDLIGSLSHFLISEILGEVAAVGFTGFKLQIPISDGDFFSLFLGFATRVGIKSS